MRYLITTLLLLLLFIGQALSNDSGFVGQGGSVRLLEGEHKSIRMVREWVRMDIYPDYYDVSAQFIFINTGPATTVKMGFPEKGHAADKSFEHKPGFLRFQTWVDGEQFNAVRLKAKIRDLDGQYGTYWVKQVSFSPGQKRTVRVKYRSQPGSQVENIRFATYSFTGGNWKGLVAESSLVAVIHMPGTYIVDIPYMKLRQKGNRFAGRWTDWQAEGNCRISYLSTLNGWMRLNGEWPGDFGTQHPVHVVVRPGNASEIHTASAVIQRHGVIYIMAGYYVRRLDPSVTDEWRHREKEYVLRSGKKMLRFRAGRSTMQVDNARKVRLPGKPFMRTRSGVNRYSCLYIPLEPVAKLLNYKVDVKPAERCVYLRKLKKTQM